MVEVIIDSFNLNTGIGEGHTKISNRKVQLLLANFRTGNENPKVSSGSSVWCVLDGSSGDYLTSSEIYHARNDRMDRFVSEFRDHYANLKGGPVNGEILIRTDGRMCRITEVCSGKLQPCGNDFFAARDLTAGYSGSLDAPIPTSNIECVGELLPARFWTWRDFIPEAHGGFQFDVNVRVWREK